MKLTTPRHRPPMRGKTNPFRAATKMHGHKPPIKCRIEVTTKDGITHIYSGLFQTTTDAAADALAKFGFGNKISVRRTA